MRTNEAEVPNSSEPKEKAMPYKHGKYRTRLYGIWALARARCQKPYANGYKDYGGRGISFCSEWDQDFEVFETWALSNGYADNLTLERKDVNGNYFPNNCIWADQNVQSANARKRPNTKFQYKGVDQLPGGRWRAIIQVRGVVINLHTHGTEREAVEARNKYIRDNQLPHLIQ